MSDTQHRLIARKVLLAADGNVGSKKKSFKDPLDYVWAFLEGADKAISALPETPTSFATIMEKSGKSTAIVDYSGLTMDQVGLRMPVKPSTFCMFIWHIIGNSEEPALAGEASALWQDKDGLGFAFGKKNGQWKLVYATGPGFAAAA